MTLYPQPDQQPTATGPEGWYVDPDNPIQSRRWDGQQWTSETGKLTPVTRRLGQEQGTQGLTPRPPAATGGLTTAGQAIYVLAALGAVASILGGIYLFQHTVTVCGPTQFDACSDTHPWKLTGAAVAIAGLLQSAVLAVVGYLCTVVDRLRTTN